MSALRYAFILLLSVVITACGGSSSSSNSGRTSSNASPVAITTSNESTIGNSAVNAATQDLSSGALTYVGGVQTSASGSKEPMMTQWADFAFQAIEQQKGVPLTAAGVSSSPVACSGGGSISFATDSTTTPTWFTITYNNCIESGIVTNGSVSLTNLSITQPSTGIYNISATFNFNLTQSGNGHSARIVGGFTIAANGVHSASRTNSFSGTSFNVSYDNYWATLSNFSFTSSYNDTIVNHGYSDTVDYTYASDFIQAGFSVHTLAPLVRNYTTSLDIRPRSGQVTVTGANNTVLELTVVSSDPNAGTMNGTVNLRLSTDGGATWGGIRTKTWTQLANGQ